LLPAILCPSLVICAALAQNERAAEKVKVEAKPIPRPTAVSPENGISIGAAKVFDNRALTLMLESLGDALRGLQIVDQDPLRKNLGLIQGSRSEEVSRALELSYGGTPKVENTAESSTEAINDLKRTFQDGKIDAKTYEDYLEKLVERKLTEKGSNKTVTTTSERTPAAPKLGDFVSTPGGMPAYGQNPSDLLSDQVNLTYQIFNLRMLLERSLTDRLIGKDARLQAVLGFNVSLDPPKDAPDAAAVVEITVEGMENQPVSLVAMMPQEKTYNAVALSTKTNAFGGAAVARMFTVGYSERRRGQNYYLYRDNDTLSFERMATPNGSVTFGWQFRPVLGRRSVAPGLRQMLAVISLPRTDKLSDKTSVKLKLTMRTYWRKYYSGNLTSANRENIGPWPWVKKVATLATTEPVPNGAHAWRHQNETGTEVEVPTTTGSQAALEPTIKDVAWYKLDDKTALVSIRGENFFTGTAVAMGGSRHTSAADGLIVKSTQAMDVITPMDNLGAGDAAVIGRYGGTTPLRINKNCAPSLPPENIKLFDAVAGQRRLYLRFTHNCETPPNIAPAVFVAGKALPNVYSRAFGSEIVVEADVPDSQVQKGGSAMVTFPFLWAWGGSVPLYDTSAVYKVERVGDADRTDLIIRKSDAPFESDLLYPERGRDWRVDLDGSEFRLAPGSQLFLINASALMLRAVAPKNPKLILYEPDRSAPGNFIPHVLDVPEAKPKAKAAVEAADPSKLIIETNDTPRLLFEGTKVGDVDSVLVGNFPPIKPEYDAEKKQLTVFVNQQITANPARLTLQFRDVAGKLLGTVELVVKARPKQTAPAPKAAAAAKGGK
jgi:hypothetical protein